MQDKFKLNQQQLNQEERLINVANEGEFDKKYHFILTKEELIEIEKEQSNYEDPKAASIGALKIIQKKRGWIEDDVLHAIADLLCINFSELEGIATFYNQIYRQPVGRHVIRYCDSIVCYITGYQYIEAEIIKLLKITPGKTTIDGRFTLLPTCCLGNCDKAPTMMIDEDTHSYLEASSIKKILEQYL